jgi:hypothetical protein
MIQVPRIGLVLGVAAIFLPWLFALPYMSYLLGGRVYYLSHSVRDVVRELERRSVIRRAAASSSREGVTP